MVISQGEVWWAEPPDPSGSEPGLRRPVVVIQGDPLNRSRIGTALCVPLTSNLRWAKAPGNVVLGSPTTGLPRESVALVAQVITLDRSVLIDRSGKISESKLHEIFSGLDIVLGR